MERILEGEAAAQGIAHGQGGLAPQERDQLVGQLTGGVAHDFNNMLATVLGCLELMERRTADPERLKALIQRASDAVERAAELNGALVHFARREPEPSRALAPNDVISKLLPLVVSAMGRRVRFAAELSPEAPKALADQTSLEGAILALCLAGRRALPNGGAIRLETVAGQPGRAALMLTVEGEDLRRPDLRIARTAAEVLGAELVTEGGADSAKLVLALHLLPAPARPAARQ